MGYRNKFDGQKLFGYGEAPEPEEFDQDEERGQDNRPYPQKQNKPDTGEIEINGSKYEISFDED